MYIKKRDAYCSDGRDVFRTPSIEHLRWSFFSHKSSIVDVRLSSKYASVMLKCNAMKPILINSNRCIKLHRSWDPKR